MGFENYPYTNFHEINLDWIVQKLKEAYSPENPPPDMVFSVNGETGNVILYPESNIRLPSTTDGQWNIFRLADGIATGIQFNADGSTVRIEGSFRKKLLTVDDIPSSSGVVSVNSQTGVVTLTGSNISWSSNAAETIQQKISELETAVEDLEDNVSDIQTDLTTAENNITDHGTRITSLETSRTADETILSEHTSLLTNHTNALTDIERGVAILANGNSHAAITQGQFVFIRNHTTLPEGIYRATANIAANGTLTTSNVTLDSAGGLNTLENEISTLKSNLTIGAQTSPSGVACASGSVVTIASFTPPEAGYYLIEATVTINDGGSDSRTNVIIVDTAETNTNTTANSVLQKGSRAVLQKIRIFSLASSDVVYIRAYQNSGMDIVCAASYRYMRIK